MVIDRPSWIRCLVAITACCCACHGCGRHRGGIGHPATAPVMGTVRLHDGTPLPKGFVQLEAVDGPPATVSGVVEAGRFSLATSFENAVLPGAAPGRYRFVVVPEFSVEPRPVRFERVYEIGASGTNVVLELPAN